MREISEGVLGAAADAVADDVAAARGEQAVLPGLDAGDEGDDLGESEAHLALPDAAEIAAIQDESGCTVAEAVREHRRRGREGRFGRVGRKPGTKNRRTGDVQRYLRQFGPDPAVALMRMLARPAEMLAEEMGCKKLEALDRQIRIAAELLPYFHGKKPVDVNVHTTGHMTLIMDGGTGSIDGGELSGEGSEEIALFQEVSDGAGGKSE